MMDDLLLAALWIFCLRLVEVTIGTLRILLVVRGKRGLAWITGFLAALIFIIAVRGVLTGEVNLFSLIGYAAGFATGNVVGMWLEGRLAVGMVRLQIVSSTHGQALAEKLRQAGYAVTEAAGRGRDGTVNLLVCNVARREAPRVAAQVAAVDPQAFITEQDMRRVQRGFMRT